MRVEEAKQADDYVIDDRSIVIEVEMGSLPSIPSVVISEPEETEALEIQNARRDPELISQPVMRGFKVRQPRVRTGHKILHSHHSVAAAPGEGDDPLTLCTRPLTLSDHFHARFGDRLHHRFKPAPYNGIRLRRRSMSVDIPGASTPSGSELVLCSGGRSVVGRGHHAPGCGRRVLRHFGCQRRWFREIQVLADEIDKELGQSKSSILVEFSVDHAKYEAQQAVASSAADFVARLSLSEEVKPLAPVDNGMGMRMIEYEKPSMELEVPIQQPELPIFEVSNLTLSDAPAESGRRAYGV